MKWLVILLLLALFVKWSFIFVKNIKFLMMNDWDIFEMSILQFLSFFGYIGFALIGILAAIFFLMMWINSRDLKKLREDGFYD